MAELTDAQLDELIVAIGLKAPRELKPCGTPAAYDRHLEHGETPCDDCRTANTRRKRDRCKPTPELRKPIAHGTPKGYKQHRYRGEQACDACIAASRDYQRTKAATTKGGAA